MEDILKLFRLTRLSLEGSMISDASCFMDCRIKEVHLPEHCLKENQYGLCTGEEYSLAA